MSGPHAKCALGRKAQLMALRLSERHFIYSYMELFTCRAAAAAAEAPWVNDL